MMIKLLIALLIFQLSLAQTIPQKSLECKSPRSKICLLQGVTSVGFKVPKFPDLTEKHTLIIRSGNIPYFNDKVVAQLGGVTKVTLGRLNIESLHIPSNWVSLNAESNQIRELTVEPTNDDASDGYLGDEPESDPDGDTPNAITTDPPIETTTLEITSTESTETTPIQPAGKTVESEPVDPTLTSPAAPVVEPVPSKAIDSSVKPADSGEAKPATTTTSTPAPDENPGQLVGYQLQSLNLASNKLQSIRELKCMVNLVELLLDGNELEFIEMSTFDGMTKLRKLSLAKNKINHITTPSSMDLRSLEWFSLAFNRLATLQIANWNMLQLVELDIGHNALVRLDVANFDQFVSLEKLALANNSWTCYWLNGALKEISKRDFITLVDRNDDPGQCPNGLPVEGICCSLTLHDDEETNDQNVHESIQRLHTEQERMSKDLKGKLGSFGDEWNKQWETLNRNVADRQKQIVAREKEPKDDSKVTDKDLEELNKLISDCHNILSNMDDLGKENSNFAQSFTQSFYTAIALKNKLLAAMRSSTKLKSDLQQYEISFKADVK